jgi:hypothetical protein
VGYLGEYIEDTGRSKWIREVFDVIEPSSRHKTGRQQAKSYDGGI